MYKFIVLLLCSFLCIPGCYKNDLVIDYSKEAVLVQISEIAVDYKIKNDLSISWKWKLPQIFNFIKTENMFINFEIITMNGASFGMFSAMFDLFDTGIRPEDIIRPLVIAYPQNPKYLHVLITKYNDTWTEKEQWYFNIDISNIHVVIAGEEMKPGIFTNFAGQWVPETITLEDGQWFMKNAYYLITSCMNWELYRKLDTIFDTEFNRNSYAIFKVDNDTEAIHNEDGKLNLNSGGLSLEEMRLRKILINGNNHEGFMLIVTPESKNIFRVETGSVPNYTKG